MLTCVVKEALAPLPNYTPALPKSSKTQRDQLIKAYFRQAYSNKDILLCVAASHGIVISIITLKRTLRRLRLRRRIPCTEELVARAPTEIDFQLQSSGKTLGYKAMSKRLL